MKMETYKFGNHPSNLKFAQVMHFSKFYNFFLQISNFFVIIKSTH